MVISDVIIYIGTVVNNIANSKFNVQGEIKVVKESQNI